MFTEPSHQNHPWLELLLSESAARDPIQGLPVSTPNPLSLNGHVDPIQLNDPPKVKENVLQQLIQDESADVINADFFPTRKHPSVKTSSISSSLSLGEVSMSPAAMFLSGFSPSAPAAPLPDSEGQVVSGYTLGPIIGYGGFSTIRRASSLSGGIVAVKIIERSDLAKQTNPTLARKRLDHEAAVWASLSHEHVLPLFSAVQTPYADYFFTLYCPAGSLFDILKRDGRPALPHDDVGTMFRQVVRGLRYLHEVAEFVHRDIKLENVLVDEMGVCRIGDFGMTRKIGEDDEEQQEPEVARPPSGRQGLHGSVHHLSLIRHNGARHRNSTPLSSSPAPARPAHIFQPGSLPYASPELLLPQTAPIHPHPAQDIWALGILLYIMLTGRLPFNDPFEPRLQMKILHGAYEMPPGIGHGAEQVLQGCLERSIPNRWTIAMVDEVAWGIGWSHEGDDVPAPRNDEDPHSASRSRSRPLDLEVMIPDLEMPFRPSLGTARRRSSSRVQRSLTRAPAPMSARSKSRGTPISPSFSALNNAILSPSSSSIMFGSALSVSPSPPRNPDRGRRLEKLRMHSRSPTCSPSPSAVPTTPLDFDQPGHFPDPAPDGAERGTSRGRRAGRGVRMPGSYAASPELEVLDETAPLWARAHEGKAAKRAASASAGRSPRLEGRLRDESAVSGESMLLAAEAEVGVVRPGSTPPAPSSVWATMKRGQGEGYYRAVGLGLGLGAGAQAMSIPGRNATRSRSVGWECIGDEYRRRYE